MRAGGSLCRAMPHPFPLRNHPLFQPTPPTTTTSGTLICPTSSTSGCGVAYGQSFQNSLQRSQHQKVEELVATPYRHGSKEKAEFFFLDGMTNAVKRFAQYAHSQFPFTIYYAFKQSEKKGSGDFSSTGWETFLDAVIYAGLVVSGTWSIRTELGNRMLGRETNALASSIVISCRPRDANAPMATRREFVDALREELPAALRTMQAGSIAPVDLAQAAIGPGMAVFSRYARVLDVSGRALSCARCVVADRPDAGRDAGRAGGRFRRRHALGRGLVRAGRLP